MNIFQSIETHYVGPSNHRASRVIATTPGGHRLTHHWDYSLNSDQNHHAAAEALRAKLDWQPIVAGGSTKRGYAWITSTL
jgi:hypothetical protein